MAARTTASDGIFSNATGTALDGGTALGTTDTIIGSHNNTIDASSQFGSSPNTGGTEAFAWSGTVTGKALTVSAGVAITCKGDYLIESNSGGRNSLILGAGCTWTFLPPSGQQYGWEAGVDNGGIFTFVGTANSRITVGVDKSLGGLSGYMTINGANVYLWTCDYVDFTNFGTATQPGMVSRAASALAVSITNCTFTGCNMAHSGSSSLSVAVTFSGNIFNSSVVRSNTGFSETVSFIYSNTGTGVATIANNGFDGKVMFLDFIDKMRFTGNYCGNAVDFSATSAWTSADYFKQNVIIITAAEGPTYWGPTKQSYFTSERTDNPHFLAPHTSVVDCIFEATHNTGVITDAGDCILNTNRVLTLTGNITLQTNGVAGRGAGVLFTLFGHLAGGFTGAGRITAEHNTCYGGAAYSETGNCNAGQIPSFKSNLFWWDSANGNFKLQDSGHTLSGGTQDVVAPTDADYNASFNIRLTQLASSTYPQSGNGYNGDFSATPGANDVDTVTDPFTAKTRCLALWSQSKGQAATVAAAKVLLNATPALITQANAGAYDWPRAGFKVTSLAIKDNGHDAVTRGAMGYQAALTAGAISLVTKTATTVDLSSTDATFGAGSYTYQWYRDTTPGFTPSAANDIVGATSLTLADTGLTAGTAYYYVLAYTDADGVTVYATEFAVTTSSNNNRMRTLLRP